MMAAFTFYLAPSLPCHRPCRRVAVYLSEENQGWLSLRNRHGVGLRRDYNSRKSQLRTLTISTATSTEQEEKDRALQTLVRGMDQVVVVLEDLDAILTETTANANKTLSDEDLKQAASASVKKHLEQLDTAFLKALDFDIAQARNAEDEMKCSLLELVKDQVLDQITTKFPPQSVEEKRSVRERRLLAQLVVVREEVRELMAGGLEDKRNQLLKFTNMPQSHVDFLETIVPLQGPALRQRLSVVFLGEMEGGDPPTKDGEEEGGANEEMEIRRETLHVLRVIGFGAGE